MNYKFRIVLVAAALMLVPTIPTLAQEETTWFGQTADGQWLAGIKLGQITNDDPGFSDADTYSLVLGYQFAREIGSNGGSSSLELEFTDSDEARANAGIPGNNWDAEAIGLYLNYRTPGTVYFKARLGILDSEVGGEINNVKLADQSDTSVAFGAGLGIILGKLQNINLEIDWTGASGDNDVNLIQIGGHYRF